MSDKKPGFLKRIFSFGRKKEEEPVVEEVIEEIAEVEEATPVIDCLLYTSPSPRDRG